jgi:uncharacterized protein YdeI (YjbR/CyaY-like superfamily)
MRAMREGGWIEPADRAAWRRWLRRHHARPEGVWLVVAKKGTTGLHLDEAVEEALCFGWIDSTAGKVDGERFRVWLAPRKRGSVWSAINKERVARLIAQRRMTDAGLAKIERAKADGSWDALNHADALHEPPDLAAALDATPGARGHWDAFPPSARKQILVWIGAAKREETRAARIERAARLAAENVRATQPGAGP